MAYCHNCGQPNSDDAAFCASCGSAIRPAASTPAAPPPAMPPGGVQEHIPNYLVPAILLLLFCCLPGGIVALVYGASVNGKLAAGDRAGALAASASAKMWCWISFGVGLGIGLIWFFIALAPVLFGGLMSSPY